MSHYTIQNLNINPNQVQIFSAHPAGSYPQEHPQIL